jgi:phosphatidylglycerophosphatase A
MPVALAMTYTPLWAQLAVVVAVSVLGTLAAEQVRLAMGVGDPQLVVVDEFAGILVTFVAVPATWATALLGFALFRIFDIAKPYPLSWLGTKVPGGFGIMVDDLGAGVFACALLQLWVRWV